MVLALKAGGLKLKILVNGATGFIGKALIAELFKQGYKVRVATRSMD